MTFPSSPKSPARRRRVLRPAPPLLLVVALGSLVLAPGAGCGEPAPPPGGSGAAPGGGAASLGGTTGSGGDDGGSGASLSDGPLFETGTDVSPETSFGDSSNFNDGSPDVGDGCSSQPPPSPTISYQCTLDTANECDGSADGNPALPNGQHGNGFDDDCDGRVDEGCECDPAHPVGTTKTCYLVPATLSIGGKAVGWCEHNSQGTLDCIAGSGGEFAKAYWEGECRGAQPPYAEDYCAAGDYNCDGVEMNPVGKDCACLPEPEPWKCPVDAVLTAPFPDPMNLLQISALDWIDDAVEAQATNFAWHVYGGDCDNVLPHPTFALYDGANSTTAAKVGAKVTNLGPNGNQHGFSWTGAGVLPYLHPAFALSGDYFVRAEWDLGAEHFVCQVKVKVRAPGLRAELCWDSVGNNDVDLHFARLQSPIACTHGWFGKCTAPGGDDCYYGNIVPFWGYLPTPEPGGYGVCHGWGSKQVEPCTNPRLDRDNISCDTAEPDPNGGSFCGPENINLDNPNPGERFAIGVQFYSGTQARPHVNLYCNGERKLSAGYNPKANPPVLFPVLSTPGNSSGGDLWSVGIVTWSGDPADPCSVATTHSAAPKAAKDGSTNFCVDTNPKNGPSANSDWLFVPGGGYPTVADDLCWH